MRYWTIWDTALKNYCEVSDAYAFAEDTCPFQTFLPNSLVQTWRKFHSFAVLLCMTIFLCHSNSPALMGPSAALPAGEVPFDPMGQRQICRSWSSPTWNSFLQLVYCRASFTCEKISLKSSTRLMDLDFSFSPHALLPSPADHITCCSLVLKYSRSCILPLQLNTLANFNALYLSYRRRRSPKLMYHFYILHILYSVSKWEKNSLAWLVIHIEAEWQSERNFSHFAKTLCNSNLWKTHQKCQGIPKQCNARNHRLQ